MNVTMSQENVTYSRAVNSRIYKMTLAKLSYVQLFV